MVNVNKSSRLVFLLPLMACFLIVSGCVKEAAGTIAKPNNDTTVEKPEQVSSNHQEASLIVASVENPMVTAVGDTLAATMEVTAGTPLGGAGSQSAKVETRTVESLDRPISLEQRFSYTYGYLLMATSKRDIPLIDSYYFARGALDSAAGGELFLSEQEMKEILLEYQDRLIAEASAQLEELRKKNLENAESFLRVNGARKEVVTTQSGLQYEVIKASEGDHPGPDDSVKVNYTLTYLDGRVADSSKKGTPSTFSLENLIPGFREGLMLMTIGSEYRFYVHPDLGYGVSGSPQIEPNTLLIFDIQLTEVVKK
jgi:FKBP-type peptidyl-prolyl cis-trans isomerase